MEDINEFIQEFRQEKEDASHLLNVKEWYRKSKIWSIILFPICITVLIIIDILSLENPNYYSWMVIALFLIMAVAASVVLTAFYIEARRCELTVEDLTYHEFAQAVDDYRSDSPQKWKEHLMNVEKLIIFHDARIASKYQEDKILRYIRRVQESDVNNPEDAYFREFYNCILYPILTERNDGIDDILTEFETRESTTSGFLPTLWRSGSNIIDRWSTKSWVPISITLGIGLGVYFLYDQTLASFLTIALLTAIGIIQSND